MTKASIDLREIKDKDEESKPNALKFGAKRDIRFKELKAVVKQGREIESKVDGNDLQRES